MWPIFTASGPASMLPGRRRRRRLFPEEQFDPHALEKLERAGARWKQGSDGTWARWSYLGSEWVEETPPDALTAVAGASSTDVIWTDESGVWAVTTEPPPVVQSASAPPLDATPVEQVAPPPTVEPPAALRPPITQELLAAFVTAMVGLFIALLVRAAVSLVVEPISVTVFVPWLWKSPGALPGIGETIRGIVLLSILLSGAWVALRRLFLAYRMPPVAAALVSLALVAGLWLTGFMLGRPV